MPLGKNVQKNIKELYADGKPRSRSQIIAIAY